MLACFFLVLWSKVLLENSILCLLELPLVMFQTFFQTTYVHLSIKCTTLKFWSFPIHWTLDLRTQLVREGWS
jgi:hypothetical protein